MGRFIFEDFRWDSGAYRNPYGVSRSFSIWDVQCDIHDNFAIYLGLASDGRWIKLKHDRSVWMAIAKFWPSKLWVDYL